MNAGVVIFAHGSSIESANAAVEAVAAAAAQSGDFQVEVGFLAPVHPTLEEAAAKLIARGARRVTIVPYFLTLGLHLQRDLPNIVARIQESHAGVEIAVTPPLDGHPALVEILLDRIRQS